MATNKKPRLIESEYATTSRTEKYSRRARQVAMQSIQAGKHMSFDEAFAIVERELGPFKADLPS